MQYLGAFPTDEQLQNEVMPKITQEEELQYIKYSSFELFMIGVMIQNLYEPDGQEQLLRAFQVWSFIKHQQSPIANFIIHTRNFLSNS